jgi:hypothetical protein
MTSIKKVCHLCGTHIEGSPCAQTISHGLCRTCADAMRRSMAGERVEMRFWEPGHRLNQGIININEVDAKLIRIQAAEGRTEREII